MAQINYNRGAVNAAQCIGDGWQVVKGDYWMYFLIALLAVVIIAVASNVPYVGGFINAILIGPITGGVLYALLRRMRGETVSFGDMFAGFNKFVPLMLIGLIQAAPGLLLQLFVFAVSFAPFPNFPRGRAGSAGSNLFVQSSGTDFAALTTGIIIVAVIAFLIFFVLSIAWAITFYFVYPLVMEHEMSIGAAIVTSAKAGWSNVGGLILLFILQGLVGIAGFLALCVGLLFVLPIIYASIAVSYRQVFPLAVNFAPDAPPPPTDYGSDYGRPTGYNNAM